MSRFSSDTNPAVADYPLAGQQAGPATNLSVLDMQLLSIVLLQLKPEEIVQLVIDIARLLPSPTFPHLPILAMSPVAVDQQPKPVAAAATAAQPVVQADLGEDRFFVIFKQLIADIEAIEKLKSLGQVNEALSHSIRQRITQFTAEQHLELWTSLCIKKYDKTKTLFLATAFIEFGADLNARHKDLTVFSRVVFDGKYIELVKLLVAHNADWTCTIRRNGGAGRGMMTFRVVDYFEHAKGKRSAYTTQLKKYFQELKRAELRKAREKQSADSGRAQHETDDKHLSQKRSHADTEAALSAASANPAQEGVPALKRQRVDVKSSKDETIVVKKEPRTPLSREEIVEVADILRGASNARFNCARYAIDVKRALIEGVIPERSTNPAPGSKKVSGFNMPITVKTEDGVRVQTQDVKVHLAAELFQDAILGGSYYESGNKIFIEGVDLTDNSCAGMYHSDYKKVAEDLQVKAMQENSELIGTLLLLYAEKPNEGFLKKYSGHVVAFRVLPGESPIFIDCMNRRSSQVFSDLASVYAFEAGGAAAAALAPSIPFAKNCCYVLHASFPRPKLQKSVAGQLLGWMGARKAGAAAAAAAPAFSMVKGYLANS